MSQLYTSGGTYMAGPAQNARYNLEPSYQYLDSSYSNVEQGYTRPQFFEHSTYNNQPFVSSNTSRYVADSRIPTSYYVHSPSYLERPVSSTPISYASEIPFSRYQPYYETQPYYRYADPQTRQYSYSQNLRFQPTRADRYQNDEDYYRDDWKNTRNENVGENWDDWDDRRRNRRQEGERRTRDDWFDWENDRGHQSGNERYDREELRRKAMERGREDGRRVGRDVGQWGRTEDSRDSYARSRSADRVGRSWQNNEHRPIPPYADGSYSGLSRRPGASKRALLIGINYRNEGKKELFGSINDARCLSKFLEGQGWPREDIIVMDEDKEQQLQPTLRNIMRELQALVHGVRAGDSLFFSFSGHGIQMKDLSGDEADGLDEVIVTVDGKPITDDLLYRLVIEKLPKGAFLTAITDCCHSGTILDMPYSLGCDGRVRQSGKTRTGLGDAICFSGCLDSQIAADVDKGAGRAGGACTNALLNSLSAQGSNITYKDLLRAMQRNFRDRKFSQSPVISSTFRLDPLEKFTISSRRESLRRLPRPTRSDALNPFIDLIQIDTYAKKHSTGPCVRSRSGDSGDFEEKAAQAIPATVHMFSGCRDEQTSADVSNTASFGVAGPDGAGGACTNSLLSVIAKNPNITWVELLEGMRTVLKQKGYKQIPELSSSHPIQLTTKYQITTGTGRHKALLVGINYVGQQSALSGCVNDVKKMKQYLQKDGYSEFRVLADADNIGDDAPTKSNILAGFDWLVSGAKPGDNLFFHYSGHGSQSADTNGDEVEGKDETIVPSDYSRAGQIVDDEIFKKLVLPLPENCQLSVVMDCCHSGTVLDLPYVFKADNSNMQPIFPNGLAGGMNTSNVPDMEQNPLCDVQKLMSLMGKFYDDMQSGNYMGMIQDASNMYNAYNKITGSGGSGSGSGSGSGGNMFQQLASDFGGGGWW